MGRICIPSRSAPPQHAGLRRIRVLPRFWRFVILLLVLIFGACALSSELKYRRCCAHLAQLQLDRDAAARRVDALPERLAQCYTEENGIRGVSSHGI